MIDDKKNLAMELDMLMAANCYRLEMEARKTGGEHKCKCPKMKEILDWDLKIINRMIEEHPERKKDKFFIPMIT